MTLIVPILLVLVGLFFLLVGVLSLRAIRKKKNQHCSITYGVGVDKHMLRTGITIEHGMVVSNLGELQPQSKTSDSELDTIIVK